MIYSRQDDQKTDLRVHSALLKQDIVRKVPVKKLALKRLIGLGFTEDEAKQILKGGE